MDPDATLQAILDHLSEGDVDDAAHLMVDLLDWLARGGFKPKEFRLQLQAVRRALFRGIEIRSGINLDE